MTDSTQAAGIIDLVAVVVHVVFLIGTHDEDAFIAHARQTAIEIWLIVAIRTNWRRK